MGNARTVHIGTSGWVYRDWRGRFYPREVPARRWLEYYAQHFETVELNSTTYRLPRPSALTHWRDDVPAGFFYIVKLSRLITHRRNLGEPEVFITNYFNAIAPLRSKIALILCQLPPYLERDDDRLELLLQRLSPDYRYVVEFRHPSWYVPEVYALLERHGAVFCIHDLKGSVSPLMATGDTAYVRLHGPIRAYYGSYSRRALAGWRERLCALPKRVHHIYIYFNNDHDAHAPRNALTLREMIGGDAPQVRAALIGEGA